MTRSYRGYTPTKGNANLDDLWGRVLNSRPIDAKNKGAIGNGIADDTAALNTAIASGAGRLAPVMIPDGTYKISDELVLFDNSHIILSAGTLILQTAANKNTFKAVQKDNVWIHCNGAVMYGLGTNWSPLWSSFAGHEDRGVQFLGCTNSGVMHPRIRNMAMAGIVVLGGKNITIGYPIIEGTHALGTPLTPGVSIYQFAIVVQHDATYGAFENVRIIHPTYYNCAMGISSVTNVPGSKGALTIVAPVAHTFLAEHGLYLSTSHTKVVGGLISDATLDGCKVFSGVANEVLENVDIDINVRNCGGQAVEYGVSGAGSISHSTVNVTAVDCARGLTIDGDVRGLKARVDSLRMTQRSLYIANSLSAVGPTDCDIELIDRDCVEHGFIVDAPHSARNRIRAKVHRPGQGGGAFGALINQCDSLVLESPEMSDDSGNMQDGLHVASTAAGVRITGHPRMFGYSNSGIFSDAPGTEWHASPGEFTSRDTAFRSTLYQGLAPTILPVTELVNQRQSTSAANVVLWTLNLDDESDYLVTVRLVGKLAGSAERGGFVSSAVFYRDGGGSATLQGAADEDVNIKSGGFLGVYGWAVFGNEARLNVNSGAAATIDWLARVTVTKLS